MLPLAKKNCVTVPHAAKAAVLTFDNAAISSAFVLAVYLLMHQNAVGKSGALSVS